jgi:MFS family permease
MMDNIGRKQALLMTWGTTTLGSAMLALSNSLAIVCLGLFLTGAGRSVTRVTITIINEIFNDSSRQKISVIL